MWFTEFEFYDKREGLSALPNSNYLSKPLTEEEKESLKADLLKTGITSYVDVDKWFIPKFILPQEFIELLQYSNSGGIINKDREFGFFSFEDIRSYYLNYHFPEYTPYFLPIAFDGSGVFYAYDFRDKNNIKIIGVSAGDLDEDSIVFLGTSLKEVLKGTTNLGEELYKK